MGYQPHTNSNDEDVSTPLLTDQGNTPPDPALQPSDELELTPEDLKGIFIRKQIETWGWEQVELWFNQGFDLLVVNGKVIWVK